MKRFCASLGIVILVLPAISYLDDAIALQDGWFNVDRLDDTISRAPHGLKPADDDPRLATLLRQLDDIQAVVVYVVPLQLSATAITVRYTFPVSYTSILPVTTRSPPVS